MEHRHQDQDSGAAARRRPAPARRPPALSADLRHGMATLACLLQTLPALDTEAPDFAGQVAAHHAAIKLLGRRLPIELPGFRIDARLSGMRVTLHGLTATSTGGLPSACRNWIAAADRELARRQNGAAQ